MKCNFTCRRINLANHRIISSFYANIPVRSKTDKHQSGSLIINVNSCNGILNNSCIFS